MPKPRQAISSHILCGGTGWLKVTPQQGANGRVGGQPSHRACWCALRDFQQTKGLTPAGPFHWRQESPPGVLAAAVHALAGSDGTLAQETWQDTEDDLRLPAPEQVRILKWYVGHFVDGLSKIMDELDGTGLRSLHNTVPGWLEKLDPIEDDLELRRYLIWLDVGAHIDPFKPLEGG